MAENEFKLEPCEGRSALARQINRLLKKPELKRAKALAALLDGFHLKNTVTTSVDGRNVVIDGRKVVNFGSANYLGFEQHPAVLEAGRKALSEWGNHSGCSRIFSSHENILRLEAELARLVGADAAMVCANTSQTHQGVIPALFGQRDAVIFLDRYAHTSMYQASLIAVAKGARLVRVDARDPSEVRAVIRSECPKGLGASVKVLMVDGVYSMQGNVPDLKALAEVCDEEATIFYIDDAHGIGIYGESGGGVAEMLGLSFANMVLTGTLQKGLGAYGGFVAGDRTLIDCLRITSRSYVFSGTLQPQAVEGGLAAIEICRSDEGKRLRAELKQKSIRLRARLQALGFSVESGDSPIVSVLIGPELKTLLAGRRLFDDGVYVNSVLYPATPKGEGLLRISLNAVHSDADLEVLVSAFEVLREYLRSYKNPLGPNFSYAREFARRQLGRRAARLGEWVSNLGL